MKHIKKFEKFDWKFGLGDKIKFKIEDKLSKSKLKRWRCFKEKNKDDDDFVLYNVIDDEPNDRIKDILHYGFIIYVFDDGKIIAHYGKYYGGCSYNDFIGHERVKFQNIDKAIDYCIRGSLDMVEEYEYEMSVRNNKEREAYLSYVNRCDREVE